MREICLYSLVKEREVGTQSFFRHVLYSSVGGFGADTMSVRSGW